MTGPLLGAGLALILTSVIPSGVPVTVLALIGTCLCGMAFGNGYTYTKELFPTCLRTTALGTYLITCIFLLDMYLQNINNLEIFLIFQLWHLQELVSDHCHHH